jgi:hypothetical protein
VAGIASEVMRFARKAQRFLSAPGGKPSERAANIESAV